MNDKSEFERAIGSHLGLLARVVNEGVQVYDERYIETAPAHSKRSKASLIHDHMIEWADRLLPAEFRRVDSQQRVLYNYRDLLLIQFNKLEHDIRRASRNNSHQALLFDEVGEVMGLPGIPAALPLVTVGYVAKEGDIGLEAIYVARIVESSPLWILRLGDDHGGDGTILPTPMPHDPRPAKPTTRIKRPIWDDVERRRDGSS
jgi:hypothetical protein